MAPVLAGAAILCLSFLGFDAVSTLSEEAKDARRDVPKAIMLATLICGVLFVILSYASQLVFPSNAFEDVDSGSLDVMQAAGGAFMAAFFTAAYVAGALGSALTSQASVARILYAMGRDGVLPRKVFGHVSVKFSTPTWAIIVISVISLLALWIDLALLASVVSFGALVAFSAVNLTVIKHYFVDEGEKNVLNNLILPFIGFALTVWPVDQLVQRGADGWVDLVGNRIGVARSGDARFPEAHPRARSGGDLRSSGWPRRPGRRSARR
jgi:putrescine importer